MNFKKYHVSRNLFDENYPNIKVDTPTYRGIYVGDGTFTLSTTTVQYRGSANLFFLAGNVGSGASTQNNGVRNGNPRTVTAVDGYVTIAYRYYTGEDASDPRSNDVMLNTGSTALPYEPYSSEVWHDTPHYIHNTSTDTLTTLPAELYPNAATATVGLKGNMNQSGTPTPQNPIQPSECGERTGNLFSAVWEQGIISSDAGIDVPSNLTVRTKGYISVNPNTIYSISRDIKTSFISLRFYDSNKNYIGTGSVTNINLIVGSSAGNPMARNDDFCCFEIINSNIKYMRISDNSNDLSTMYMMVEGEYTKQTMPSYEPYGYKIPISSASTTTPVYLGEVETTRRIKKLVLDGTEDWRYDGTAFYINISSMTEPVISNSPLYCSHFVNSSQGMRNGTNWAFVTKYETATTTSDWKSYLAQQYANGTPVTVWYVLATPQTAVVNEPLMRIGDYADTLSNISIPVTAGGDTISVDTTVQPSEVTVNYKGWHPVADVHERDNGAWT